MCKAKADKYKKIAAKREVHIIMKHNTAPTNDTDLSKEIPTFDISEFDTNPDGFAQKIGDGIQEFGFCGIKNHGISDDLIQKSFSLMEQLFALPEDIKKSYIRPKTGGQRGYTPFQQERAKSSSASDLKEFWHMGRILTQEHKAIQSTWPEGMRLLDNVWPNDIVDFKETMAELYAALDNLSDKILASIALYLKQDASFFATKTGNDDSILRMLHYPPQEDLSTPAIRAGAHEDINLITLLVGSNEPGLEILDKNNRWIPVTSIEGTIVCNIADMLQRFTNDIFPSRTHRVINPEGPHRLKSRYSIPFFKHLNRDCLIETIPTCVSDAHPNKYEPITAYHYLIQRLVEIDLIPQEALADYDLPKHALEQIAFNAKQSGQTVSDVLKVLINHK